MTDRKSQRYDRQLRLWGDHGQSELESARVCLINGSATGTETLKNLVLPGIGSFTVVDGAKVSGEDAGNNFFLEESSIGKSRAQQVAEFLSELNSDVSGAHKEESLQTILDEDPEFFRSFTIVIATQVVEKQLVKLSQVLHEYNVPLLAVRSYGMCGILRLQISEHTIIESHPDNPLDDLRLDKPFPGLVQYVESINFEALDNHEHMHVPWVAILLRSLKEWKASHDGQAPKTSKEKDEFKKLIRSQIRLDEHGSSLQEENFEEAIRHATKAWQVTQVPSNVNSLFADPSCENVSSLSSNFWILVRALREFVSNEGQGLLPLRGSIPDMAADSQRYILLQKVYHEQAMQDVYAVTNHARKILVKVGLPEKHISEQDIRTFCKNASFLNVIRCRTISDEYTTPFVNEEAANFLDDPDSILAFYFVIRGADKFFEQNQRFPGHFAENVEEDIGQLKECVNTVIRDANVSATIKEDLMHEISRYGASELHSIASFMGGIASQEAVKIITGQYVPLNGTYIYNAVNSSSMSISL